MTETTNERKIFVAVILIGPSPTHYSSSSAVPGNVLKRIDSKPELSNLRSAIAVALIRLYLFTALNHLEVVIARHDTPSIPNSKI